MNLKTKSTLLVVLCFFVILASSYILLQLLNREIRDGLATWHVKKEISYNRARVLQPLLREIALARKLADSTTIRRWANNEENPALRAAALVELDDYRRFFSDHSYFFAIRQSGHYYYNDRENSYAGSELRYSLNADVPDDLWFYRTMEKEQEYALNVDFDEKLQVTKVWINVVVRDADRAIGVIGTGIALSDFIASVVTSDQSGITNMFIETGGAIQAHNKKDLIDFRTISKDDKDHKTVFQLLDRQQDITLLKQTIVHLQSGTDEVDVLSVKIAGADYLLGIGSIPEIGWYNITLLDTSHIIGTQHLFHFAILLFLALFLLALALKTLLDRLVIRRISRLDQLVHEVAEGTQISFPGVRKQDEMGRLEFSFQQMAIALQEHAQTLERKVSERTRELSNKNLQLLESEEKFAKSFYDHPIAMQIIDLISGERIEFNDSYCQMTGYSRDELLHSNAFIDTLWVDPDAQKTTLKKLQDEGQFHDYPVEILNKSGDSKIGLASATILDIGERNLAIAAFVDITEQRKTEAANTRLESQLRHKYKMEAIGIMAGGIAHNFNNSLSVILGNIELSLAKLPEQSAAAPFLGKAKSETLKSGELVKQILSYSQKSLLILEPLQLLILVEETLDQIKANLPDTINLRETIDPDCHNFVINADASQVQKVLINLCRNAWHAMKGKGELEVTLEVSDFKPDELPPGAETCQERYAQLSIRDTGCGMSKEIQEKIFDPFFTTKEINEGTGMGLATAQGIIAQHGGVIKVSSTPGEGSTFTVFFPEFVAAKSADRAAIETTQLKQNGGR